MPRTPRVIAVGLLWLVLASSTLQAIPSASHPQEIPWVKSEALVTAAWKWLVSILAPTPAPPGRDSALSQTKEEHGSQVDPDGNH